MTDKGKPEPDQRDVPPGIPRRLIESQFPHWAGLPIRPVASSGTDNALFRLGEDMVIRIPRAVWATEQVAKEWTWLPRLAPGLPLPVPEPIALGKACDLWPWDWSVCKWLEGEDGHHATIEDFAQFAGDLGRFVRVLQSREASGGPLAGRHNNFRGAALAGFDARVRAAIVALGDLVHAAPISAAWKAALAAPSWTHDPVWIHGDLQGGNVLVSEGELAAVIDFGLMGVGDPASDLIVAWNFLPSAVRETYRDAVRADDAAWERGKGWALATALIALPYYLGKNDALVRQSWQVLDALVPEGISRSAGS